MGGPQSVINFTIFIQVIPSEKLFKVLIKVQMGTDFSKQPTMTEVVYGHRYTRPKGKTPERILYQFRKEFGLEDVAAVSRTASGGQHAAAPMSPPAERAVVSFLNAHFAKHEKCLVELTNGEVSA